MKTSGIRISAKAKVNDTTHTLKAVENEASHYHTICVVSACWYDFQLTNLRACTGVETIFYTMCGSTDCPLRGVAFATEGVSDFMGTVMNIDHQDLVSKMEGFSVQGMQGKYHFMSNRCSAETIQVL